MKKLFNLSFFYLILGLALGVFFREFTKLNDFVQGTGLGLSISQSVIEKMKGHIGVESKGEGKGSTFWFTIPYLPVHTVHWRTDFQNLY